MPTANEVRQQFVDFFVKKHGMRSCRRPASCHFDDPTLLFTNAGMNQFKDVFLGTGTRPYRRAANTQKCIRAGGKHNDLDDVGKDTYHHTFSKCSALVVRRLLQERGDPLGVELLTSVWGLDKSRLHATVFEGDPEHGLARDDEAASAVARGDRHRLVPRPPWQQEGQLLGGGRHRPCGPCTEIHIDRTPDKSGGKLVNKGTPDVIEIWNLVFIQFNRGPTGS